MKFQQIIEQVTAQPGNLQREKEIYIAHSNMYLFAKLLGSSDIQCGFLITPYLISKSNSIYELCDYEFDVEISDTPSHYIEYNAKNILPQEVAVSLKPQLLLSSGDSNFCKKAIIKYIKSMEKMTFSDIITIYSEFSDSNLVYQVFSD